MRLNSYHFLRGIKVVKIGTMTAQQVLRECELFSKLSDAELEKVASSVLEKQYEAGTTIFQEGGQRRRTSYSSGRKSSGTNNTAKSTNTNE